MKKFGLLALIVFFGSCASLYEGYTTRSLVKVSGEKRVYEPIGTKSFELNTSNLRVAYTPDIAESGNSFEFVNKSNKPIKIIWDESSFVHPGGDSEKVFHSGVKLKNRSGSQPPSIIPPGAKLTDVVIPASKVEFKDYGAYGARWEYAPLCGTKGTTSHRLDDASCIGKTFAYFFTYQVGEKKKTVNLKFKYVSKSDGEETQGKKTAKR